MKFRLYIVLMMLASVASMAVLVGKGSDLPTPPAPERDKVAVIIIHPLTVRGCACSTCLILDYLRKGDQVVVYEVQENPEDRWCRWWMQVNEMDQLLGRWICNRFVD